MIDTAIEQPYSAAELSRLLAEKKKVERSESTLGKWMIYGLKRGDEQIKLESLMIGGQRCSSLEAYDRFIKRLNEEGE